MVQHFAKNAQQSDNESRLLYELGLYLENCGLSEPVNQVSYKDCTTFKKSIKTDKKYVKQKLTIFFLFYRFTCPSNPRPN